MALIDIYIADALFVVVFVVGGVVAFTGRRRAPGTALPAALGFGCQLVATLVEVARFLLVPLLTRTMPPAAVYPMSGAITVLIAAFHIIGYLLLLLALLRALTAHASPSRVGPRYGQVHS